MKIISIIKIILELPHSARPKFPFVGGTSELRSGAGWRPASHRRLTGGRCSVYRTVDSVQSFPFSLSFSECDTLGSTRPSQSRQNPWDTSISVRLFSGFDAGAWSLQAGCREGKVSAKWKRWRTCWNPPQEDGLNLPLFLTLETWVPCRSWSPWSWGSIHRPEPEVREAEGRASAGPIGPAAVSQPGGESAHQP